MAMTELSSLFMQLRCVAKSGVTAWLVQVMSVLSSLDQRSALFQFTPLARVAIRRVATTRTRLRCIHAANSNQHGSGWKTFELIWKPPTILAKSLCRKSKSGHKKAHKAQMFLCFFVPICG